MKGFSMNRLIAMGLRSRHLPPENPGYAYVVS